jgi:hypothetical protein
VLYLPQQSSSALSINRIISDFLFFEATKTSCYIPFTFPAATTPRFSVPLRPGEWPSLDREIGSPSVCLISSYTE